MGDQLDWNLIRRHQFANANTPPEWPVGVRPISMEGLQLLGVDNEGRLCWDGKQLQTVTRLGLFERALATLVAIGTLSMAIFDILRFFGFGFA